MAVRLLIISLVIFACQTDQPKAKVEILAWEQVFDESSNRYNPVEIHYQIINTGDVHLDYFSITVRVTCVDNSGYESSDFGYDIPPDSSIVDFFYIDTEGKKAVTVEIIDWEVKSF